MRRKIIIFTLIFLAVAISAFLINAQFTTRNGFNANIPDSTNKPSANNLIQSGDTTIQKIPNIPLDRAGQRVTKKPFGIYITPQNSPVQPERFKGYHTGADYEILPGEENIDVPVRAVCAGKLRVKQFVSGYGGVAIQDCQIQEENVTVLYGHLSLASIKHEVGNEILEMEFIGNLGDLAKGETDGERKHLHLGIHRGSPVNFRGYVSLKNELSGWIDPCLYFCQ